MLNSALEKKQPSLLRRLTIFPWPEIILLSLVAASLLFVKLRQPACFDVATFDAGIYGRLIWNIAHGQGYHGAVGDQNHLGEHFSPIVILLAPFCRIWHPVSVLMAAQAIAFISMLVLLLLLARDILKDLTELPRRLLAGGIVLMCLVAKPTMSALWFEFHPSTLGMPLVVGIVLLLRKGRIGWVWMLVPLLLATKELGPISLGGIAIYAWLVLGRWRLALALAFTAAISSALIVGVIMPWARDGQHWAHATRIGVWQHIPQKAAYLGWLLAGTGFLPILGWRSLLAAAPTTLLNLVVAYEPQFSLHFHYDDQNSMFWFIAALHGIREMSRLLSVCRVPAKTAWVPRAYIVLAIAALCFYARGRDPITEIQRSLRVPWAADLRRELAPFWRQPDEVRIITQNGFGAHFCDRRRLLVVLYKDQSVDLRPGDIIILSPLVQRQEVDIERLIAQYDRDEHCQVLHATRRLKVYRVTR